MAARRVWAAVLVVLCGIGTAPIAAAAEQLSLRRLMTDELGNFTVLFSLLDENQEPVSASRLARSWIVVQNGEDPARLRPLDMEDVRLGPLAEYGAPFRIYLLLPNTDRFNGTEGAAGRPDAAGLRQAVGAALATLPERADVSIQIGLYNDEVRWMPESDATRVDELAAALLREEAVAAEGTTVEDPFNAIDNAYRTRLRRQAREAGSNDYVINFVVITGGPDADVPDDVAAAEAARLRELLSAPDMADVTTQLILYDPAPAAAPDDAATAFARAVTPPSGTLRVARDPAELRNRLAQTFRELTLAPVVRFRNDDIDSCDTMWFRLSVTHRGAPLLSNAIVAHSCCRGCGMTGGAIVIGSAVAIVLILTAVIVAVRLSARRRAAAAG